MKPRSAAGTEGKGSRGVGIWFRKFDRDNGVADVDGLAKAGRGGESISLVATAADPAEGAAAGTEGKDHRGAGIWSGKLD